ncbi:exo-alpha-sialidase [Streptomyces sp. HU2014]|uniref:sialidase family protein n=1 Tax=Streptomyces sp. HU2014 TaxID=2939414 RepID=UPI0020109FAC|nr:sialidase family protein [Streptomyces sp. HU2014]UQI46999.1 exo-alpha-sialidase [Streptomyces sp. HU2014]
MAPHPPPGPRHHRSRRLPPGLSRLLPFLQAPGLPGPRRTVRGPHSRALTAATVTAALALAAHPVPARATADPAPPARTGFAERVLFSAAQDGPPGEYSCFRIPALVAGPAPGTVLAFAEGRKGNCGDATDIDVVLKRSADGGRTWGPLQLVDEGDGDTHGNPAPVVDRATGRVVLVTTYNKGRQDAANCDVPCDRTPHVQYSDDAGGRWSRPRDLTKSLRPPGWNSWYATGPGHGIQLTRGPDSGRLVVGVNAESHDGTRGTANHAALALSDDGGRHWRLGAVDTHPIAPDGTFRQMPSELTLAERTDGTVYVNGREQNGTDLGHRDDAVSRDGGESFTAPFRALPDLAAPMVQGSVTALRPGRWLLSVPADPDRRRTMTIRSSYDQGHTWESAEHGARVTTDWSGYSDLAVVSPGTAGLLYEAGKGNARDEIRFARFTEEWLGPRTGPGTTTADRGTGGRNGADGQAAPGAYVLGGARPVAGRWGGALAFDGVDDAVRLPYRDSLPLGEKDFTATLWFRGGGTPRGEQPLLWLGGVGGAPQVAVRWEAAARRVSAQVTAVSGPGPARTATLRTAVAPPGDGRWHFVALRRAGGRLTLTVDDAASWVADVPGSVSRGSTFGAYLGQKPDGRAYLAGELDDVRVFGRGLPEGEVAAVRAGRGAGRAVVWLPLDGVRASSSTRPLP